jgi:hypothetical protein
LTTAAAEAAADPRKANRYDFDKYAPEYREKFQQVAAEMQATAPVAWSETHGGHFVASTHGAVFEIARSAGYISSDVASIVPAVLTMGLMGFPLAEYEPHVEPTHASVCLHPHDPKVPEIRKQQAKLGQHVFGQFSWIRETERLAAPVTSRK